MIRDPQISNDGDGRDPDTTDPANCGKASGAGHGTHLAGVIGVGKANNGIGVAGINWKIKVQPVRGLGTGGSGAFEDVIDGIRWAAGYVVSGTDKNEHAARIIFIVGSARIPRSEGRRTNLLFATQ